MAENRQKKAILWAGVALVLCSLPLGARVWLHKYGAVERPNLGVVGDFVIRDEKDQALTKDQLRKSVTLMVYLPSACVGSANCTTARDNVNRLMSWIQNSLVPTWTEEKNNLVLGIIGPGAVDLQAPGQWRRFPSPVDENTLLPAVANMDQPWIVVIDNVLQFAALEIASDDLDLTRLGRVLSKTSFDQYLGNYLSKRTFMGPKRTQN